MPWGLRDSKDLGRYLSLAQVGMEFVAPIVLGVVLDLSLGWMPVATVIGALLGFVGGMYHLVAMLTKMAPDSTRSKEDRPQ
jgi:hypothetical protein